MFSKRKGLVREGPPNAEEELYLRMFESWNLITEDDYTGYERHERCFLPRCRNI